ncbi:cytochrome P450 6k1-like [Cephus cinctus]|uniref:Cytochrome P450 6k1-like n=1 Tax=Cephus cinctus TaxID=211228 RepID=A0AAJ7BVE9_CEPCN|nr:cytochrome P450 6k1-like [Cephus cinctus]XP_015595333.1 cytochrome P450 6k1-like [Cephus cinctus]
MFSLAGLETSATTTAFTLLELARNIEIQERVREEIKEKIKENGLTYESVQEMKYLHQTIAETLRLVPPAPILDRVALVDYKIPGTDIVIKKGTVIYTPLCGLHEDPKYFPNPQSYDPDRFSDERKNDIVPCTYMPFGDGPRICIGQRLGLLQVAVGLITILKDFEISLNPIYKNEVDPRAIFVRPTNGINLYFNRISTATLSSSSNH